MLDKEIHGTFVPATDTHPDTTVYGGFQCDDMGLGKTIQVTAVITNHVQHNTLLFAPLAMIDTWTNVLQHAGCNVYQVVDKKWTRLSSSYPIPLRFIGKRPAVYVTNYEKLMTTSTSLFTSISWNRIVLDEAHKIRNADGRLARAAFALVAPIRWVVTGTPLVNSLKDVVSLLHFLRVPSSSFRWEPRYLTLLPELLLHRSLDSLRGVIPDAPPVPLVHNLVLPFRTLEEEEFYHGVQGGTEEMMLKYAKDQLSAAQSFKLLLRLRQISVHPQIYISAKRREEANLDAEYEREDWVGSSTKLDAIRDIISTDSPSSHNYLIFCQFHEEMSLIRQSLLDLVDEDAIMMYHGALNQKERAAVLKKSKELHKKRVMLLQLQAGGVGLNLQEYDRVIFVSPWWTAALMDQAVARAVRMGQTSVVHVYHLSLKSEKVIESSVNIDSLVAAKADQKRRMLERLFAICS